VKIIDADKGAYERISLPGNGENKDWTGKISVIFNDTTGILWTFGKSMLSKIDPKTGIATNYWISDEYISNREWGSNLDIQKIFPGESGTLWMISMNNGLMFHFIPETEKLSVYPVPRYIDFTCIKDNTGSFWIGSIVGYIHRLVTDSLPFFSIKVQHKENIAIMRRSMILEDKNGMIRAALSSGIWQFRNTDIGSGIRLEKENIKGDDINANCIFEDSGGNLWFGCSGGNVIKYSPSDNSKKRFRLPLDQNIEDDYGITIIDEDRSGNIWICYSTYGIFKLEPGSGIIEAFLSFRELSGIAEGFYITDFMIDNNDKLWISTFNGLFRTDKDKKEVVNYAGFDGTGKAYGSFYARVISDNNNNVWVLNTLEGPYLFNPANETFSNIALNEEYYGIFFSDLLFDRYNNLWIIQNKSIIIADPVTHASRKISVSQDLQFIQQSLRLKSGQMVYLWGDNFYIFPKSMPVNRSIPPVYITGIYVNGLEFNQLFPEEEPVTDLRKIDLNFNQNHLEIEFAALNYLNPEDNRYRYFMKGIDTDTSGIVNDLSVEYRKMAPGNYTFWVTGSNNDSIWNPDGVTLEIRIRPPFYRSAIAFLIYFIMFVSAMANYIRLRTIRLTREKLRLETEVRQRTLELEDKNRQLEEIDKTKTRFFTNISHEIRTPLSLILGPLETLQKEHSGDEKEEGLLELMKRNGQRLMQLVNQLLDISKLDSGKMKIILSEEDILRSIRILVYEFLSLAESKKIKYLVELPEYPFITWFDWDKIEKIISNLLTNAFKFIPVNGTVLCSISINKGTDNMKNNILEIKVRDTGPGMTQENINMIFERFYRVESHHEMAGEGTGIGLSLTREFVELLHGTIEVKSDIGAGSEFTVKIPLGFDHLERDEFILTDKLAETKDVHPKTQRIDLQCKVIPSESIDSEISILVVEDNTDLRNYIRDNLTPDYRILEAGNGSSGVTLATTMIPDLILTDLMMPEIDGVTLCSRLKNDERTSHIPIIMLTAKATTRDKIEGLKSGADDYLVKPFNMEELKVRISNLLEQRERLRQKYRTFREHGQAEQEVGSIDDRFMEKINRLISENIRDFNFDAGDIHELLGMSRVHLYRKLKAITGLSPSIYLRNMRLEISARLLKNKSGNITEVSNSVGISNPSYFTKCFRNYFGISPKDYNK
jgi:signal transduction histidine kinase/DNA-binding response OmpR family regulator/streptogramin lyase